jgi:hypothetical protein
MKLDRYMFLPRSFVDSVCKLFLLTNSCAFPALQHCNWRLFLLSLLEGEFLVLLNLVNTNIWCEKAWWILFSQISLTKKHANCWSLKNQGLQLVSGISCILIIIALVAQRALNRNQNSSLHKNCTGSQTYSQTDGLSAISSVNRRCFPFGVGNPLRRTMEGDSEPAWRIQCVNERLQVNCMFCFLPTELKPKVFVNWYSIGMWMWSILF